MTTNSHWRPSRPDSPKATAGASELCVVRDPQGITSMLAPGSFGHGGAYGTQAWIDPEKKRIFILLVQRATSPTPTPPKSAAPSSKPPHPP